MNSRIAIGTNDGVSVADHLARSAAFVVLEIQEGNPVSRTVRERGSGECGNHKTFVEMLEGCETVICGGIGQGAFDSLTRNGIRPLVIAGGQKIDDAVSSYLAGTLATTDARVCLCH